MNVKESLFQYLAICYEVIRLMKYRSIYNHLYTSSGSNLQYKIINYKHDYKNWRGAVYQLIQYFLLAIINTILSWHPQVYSEIKKQYFIVTDTIPVIIVNIEHILL